MSETKQIKEWLPAGVEQALQSAKAVSLLATLVGTYYFIAYLAALDIPFPADFAVLPTVLLVIGVVTVGITAVVFGYILLAGWIHADPMNIGYAEFIHRRSSGLIGYGGRGAATTITAIFLIPYFVWVVVLYEAPRNEINTYYSWLLAFFAAWACVVAFGKLQEMRKRGSERTSVKHFVKIAASVFLLSFVTTFSSLIYLILLETRGLMKSWDQIALSIIAFAAINAGILYPSVDVSEFRKANQDAMNGNRIDPLAFTKKIYKGPVLFAVGILVLITVIPPFSSYVGELPTKLLGLSSNESRLIFTDRKTGKAWPPSLRDTCDSDSCWSVPVIVAIDFGKYLYVRPKGGGALYRLERKNIVEQLSDKAASPQSVASKPGRT